ncbi:MAG: histidinol-phosphate transaminase [Phocaeicola sp.]|uniref:histidinol-phosphate transaminase n=1 Tax=Phocaeicola sp. TaxID=2773926 RepID=UPI003F9F485A
MKSLKELTRQNILALEPYSSARNEYSGHVAHVFLDANENPYNHPFNRYPDPLQLELKKEIARIKKVSEEQIFLGNGSDEAIDLPYRCFCRPGIDNVVAIEPTYGMYKVCADINDIAYRPVLLDEQFQLSAGKILAAVDENTKLIWICSPNNPTGNNMNREEVINILQQFNGLVIVDEAYSDFSDCKPFREELNQFPNLIVLNTFSKAWGCAAIRLGMAFAQKDIIDIFNKVKYPYNVNALTQREALKAIQRNYMVDQWIKTLVEERGRVMNEFSKLSCSIKVYPTDANFFLVKVTDAVAIYHYLVEKGIIVRNRTKITLCKDCLRVTIGDRSENDELLEAMNYYNQ